MSYVMIIAALANINDSNILKLCRAVSSLLKNASVRFRVWAHTPWYKKVLYAGLTDYNESILFTTTGMAQNASKLKSSTNCKQTKINYRLLLEELN